MIPLTIGQYIKEESVSQFVDIGDHYELAFYGSGIKWPFIKENIWYHGVMNAIKMGGKKLAICYMREPAFAHDEHVEKQILLGHDLVKEGVDPKNIIYFYSTDLGRETHKVIAKHHNLNSSCHYYVLQRVSGPYKKEYKEMENHSFLRRLIH